MNPGEFVPSNSWSDTDWNMFDLWLRETLTTHPVVVKFTKKDETERIMNCTLYPPRLPPVVIDESKTPRKVSPNVIRVFDLDLDEWRSIIPRSVKSVSFPLDGWVGWETWPYPTGPKP